jgi:8-oxo-dGTP pyrophosphatase MutT (NUDIX family)
MTSFIDFLESRLKLPLPGTNSHLKMTPKVMQKSFRNLTPAENAKHSAVLVPLIIFGNDIQIIFTLRSNKLKSHSGQISFPGGRIEKDESTVDAALRETYEEIGLPPENIKVIGSLSTLYVPPSNNLIHTFVGLINELPEYNVNSDEVEECFTVPLKYFLNPENHQIKQHKLEGYEVVLPYWNVGKPTILWGATSMILRELLDLYEEFTFETN